MRLKLDRAPRSARRDRKLWIEEKKFPVSLGCLACFEFQPCGGVSTAHQQFTCLAYCCGQPESCDVVCRRHPDFARRVWEIDGFDLDRIPRSNPIPVSLGVRYAPLLYHAGSREETLELPVVGLSLYSMVERKTGVSKFDSRSDICRKFRFSEKSKIVLSGTHDDRPLERWWEYGPDRRAAIISSFRRLGINLVTAPNFSMFINQPRWDDLHAMKRIALCYEEFSRGGVPIALHVNGRSPTDFKRWGNFICERDEIEWLAYEFGTGAGSPQRRQQHLDWLEGLCSRVNRPLKLVIRGAADAIPELSTCFSEVLFLDTSAFMKAVHRQRALRVGNSKLGWTSCGTPLGAPVDELFSHNIREITALVDHRWAAAPGAS